ncbi:hypothetical protein [Streptomyces sp. NPDC052127]|uniref:hypothetical protein n=1 Tax=Streptomyces sp. NPDC052127 TaxID=3155679 RepID=UPI003419FEF2
MILPEKRQPRRSEPQQDRYLATSSLRPAHRNGEWIPVVRDASNHELGVPIAGVASAIPPPTLHLYPGALTELGIPVTALTGRKAWEQWLYG